MLMYIGIITFSFLRRCYCILEAIWGILLACMLMSFPATCEFVILFPHIFPMHFLMLLVFLVTLF